MTVTRTRGLNPSLSFAALALALLALLATAAGVGYAAGQIGTNQIKNNAITTPKIKKNAVNTKKVKNGSLKAADLVKEEKQKKPTFLNGGEGDCIWKPGSALAAGLAGPTYRMDRFGRVVLGGVAIPTDGPGGDGICNSSDPGQGSDGIAFKLPAKYIPAKTILLVQGATNSIVIAGPAGLVDGGLSLAPGTVFSSQAGFVLDGLVYDPVGAKVVLAKTKTGGRYTGSLAKALARN
ncbi:hypothetical protein [Nocardioides sp.]|uniref:hypothetical protein n=1 Tax=Nocardioides sp. TaxID=35761 RepID=UPI003561C577